MSIVISISVQKGGSGKSTTAVNLAYALSRKPFNKSVLVVDLDPQGNSTATLGTQNPSKYTTTSADLFDSDLKKTFQYCITESKYAGIDLIPSNLNLFATGQLVSGTLAATHSLEAKLDAVTREKYDFIIIDTPPYLGGPFVLNALVVSDHIIIPIESASMYSLMGIDQFLSVLTGLKVYNKKEASILGVLITKYDPRTNASKSTDDIVIKQFGEKVFRTHIHRSTTVSSATLCNQAVGDYDKKSPSARNFREFAEEVLERLGIEPSKEPVAKRTRRGRPSADEVSIDG